MNEALAEPKRGARRTIAIAGAGIAGLTTALALTRKGFRVVVLEKQAQPSTAGAGIQLAPNACKVLDDLDLGKAIRAAGDAPDSIIIRSGTSGKTLSTLRLEQVMQQKYGVPYLAMHRADLLQILISACENDGSIDLRFGLDVRDVAIHAHGVTVLAMHSRGSEEVQASALIGADGVWSALRKGIDTASEPKFTGQIAWRCLIPMEAVPRGISQTSTGLWLGPSAHLVHYPLRSGTVLNVVAITPWQHDSPPERGWISNTHERHRNVHFREWNENAQELLRARVNWGGWPLYAVDQMREPAARCACLIGDAAHAMLPYAAQGGAAAIEDAACIAKLCGEFPKDLTHAFSLFSKGRTQRVNRMLALARTNQRIYHLPQWAALFRDPVMRLMGEKRLLSRLDWLYDWEV